jgi:hypothetical protein
MIFEFAEICGSAEIESSCAFSGGNPFLSQCFPSRGSPSRLHSPSSLDPGRDPIAFGLREGESRFDPESYRGEATLGSDD